MSPLPWSGEDFPFRMYVGVPSNGVEKRRTYQKPEASEDLILEAWAQGCMVGSLVILGFITLANMRKGVLLHKVSVPKML